MLALTDAKWQEINSLVKEIYTVSTDDLLRTISSSLMKVIPSSKSMYHHYRKSGSRLIPYDYHSENIDSDVIAEYKRYEDLDYLCWYTDVPEPRVYRDTDFISEELRLASELMKCWLLPNDLYYSLGCTIAHNGHGFGAISLFKGKLDGDFTDEDVRVLEIINEHLSLRLYNDSPASDMDSDETANLMKKYRLTDKEAMIVRLVKSGCLRESLPEKLFISDNTLKKHLYNIYRKLGISKFEELLQFAIDHSEHLR